VANTTSAACLRDWLSRLQTIGTPTVAACLDTGREISTVRWLGVGTDSELSRANHWMQLRGKQLELPVEGPVKRALDVWNDDSGHKLVGLLKKQLQVSRLFADGRSPITGLWQTVQGRDSCCIYNSACMAGCQCIYRGLCMAGGWRAYNGFCMASGGCVCSGVHRARGQRYSTACAAKCSCFSSTVCAASGFNRGVLINRALPSERRLEGFSGPLTNLI
jgi:hypothetical protein